MGLTVCTCPPEADDIRCPQHGASGVYVAPVTLFPVEEIGPFVLRLPFTRPPLLVNEARSASGHWGEAAAKKIVAAAVVAVVVKARVPALERVTVSLTWHVAGWGIHDPDGLGTMAKAAIDGLTPARSAVPRGAPTKSGGRRKKAQAAKLGAGIIPDDHARFVESVTLRIILGAVDPRIELRLDPLPGMTLPPPRARRGQR